MDVGFIWLLEVKSSTKQKAARSIAACATGGAAAAELAAGVLVGGLAAAELRGLAAEQGWQFLAGVARWTAQKGLFVLGNDLRPPAKSKSTSTKCPKCSTCFGYDVKL